jgi:heptosyltransferase III
LGFLLASLVGSRTRATSLCAEEIHSVLICRINGRLGNTLFITPLIRQVHELLPDASIDLALAYPKAGELLGGMPGVRRIILFPHKTPRMIPRYVEALRRMRECRYDLAIDPMRQSTGGRVALTLCRSRFRLGFATRDQWARLTHAVPEPPDMDVLHEALRPIFLLSHALGAPYTPDRATLWLPLSDSERELGRRRIAHALACDSIDPRAIAVGFFAHAAHFKVIDRVWWHAFWEAFLRLEARAIPVEFLPSPTSSPVLGQFPRVHVPSLRLLAASISSMRLFISTDAGPMHLASSTQVPTVGLFHASDPTLYRPLKSSDLAIEISHCSPQAAARCCHRVWRLAGGLRSNSALRKEEGVWIFRSARILRPSQSR